MLGSEVAGPDDFVRMPWQSFSTMKRFISEGNRLENASWRLWHMQRLNRLAARTEAVDDPYDDILRASRKCSKSTTFVPAAMAPSSSDPAALVPSSNKVWEHKMDALFQKLMVTSMHHDGDIRSFLPFSFDSSDSHYSPATSDLQCTNCHRAHVLTECPLLPPPSSFSSKKAKRLACGNCRGDHMTIECPQMPQASTPKADKAAFVRKVYTNYHNENASNSTHAYLGDEVSVHGMAAYPRDTAAPVSVYESIIEEESSSHPVDDFSSPILPPLAATLSARRPDVWILSSLQELPTDLSMQRMRKRGTACRQHCWDHDMETYGYVYLRSSTSTQWVRRYMVLFRNTLVEYRDEDATRPMGFANVSEAEMALEDDGMLTLAVTASALRTQEWAVSSWKFDDPTGDGRRWLDALTRASRLQWTDFYTEDVGAELGQGRFSVVKRARRKVPSACVAECALKIIDKAVFWKLVEQGIERNDTLFREVLTQTVLTMRSDAMHECFVVQVISLFETHDHLVIEMELMHGGDVFDRIADKGPMSEHEAAIFISHLIQGIDFCFNNGVVHRDVKLSNLALDEGTEIGASRRCGTPGYVAPEILLAGVNEAYPPHVDMFSAGVVLYTLLCGYEPFFGRNDKELIALNKAVVYSFHPQEWAHISDHAKELIQLMMQPDARGRITAQEALRHPFLKDIPVASFAGAMACARLF
ncbi:hypothetical protein DYB35_011647 [Aphanomyces astaci]|uniref:Protein kinase domain-containing protein n=1 Tax=Aphanomyces astaci TaxID=112090 RepID=A0A3R7AQ66_APHAT|nr:hypothetical protein DYB35_011647 [Aphanomyces astaci]